MTRLSHLISAAAVISTTIGAAQAEPRLTYTRHSLVIRVSDLDVRQPADRQKLHVRIQDAADEVCGGRPDKGDRYTAEERKVLMPAYEKCHAGAIQHMLAQLNFPAMPELAQNTF